MTDTKTDNLIPAPFYHKQKTPVVDEEIKNEEFRIMHYNRY